MNRVFTTVLRRDLRLAARRRTDALLPIAFFVIAASLFPIGIGPEPAMLRQVSLLQRCHHLSRWTVGELLTKTADSTHLFRTERFHPCGLSSLR